MNKQIDDDSQDGPVMQPPVSGTIPSEMAEKLGLDVAESAPQAHTTGQPPEESSRTEEAPEGVAPVGLGLDESDLNLLSPEERAKMAPLFKKVEREVNRKLETASEKEQKAAAWDAALTVPAVVKALEMHLDPDAAREEGAPANEQISLEVTDDVGDLDAGKLQAVIAQTVQKALADVVNPLKQEVEALRGHVAKTALDSQFDALAATIPDLKTHRAEIMDKLARGVAPTIEDAYDQIQGRLLREGKLKPSTPETPAPTPEQHVRQTVVTDRAGPTPVRMKRSRTVGMYDHLAQALSELGADGIE